ncbi:MAG: transcription antitermination factor NusB [Bacillota bacterium]
MSRKTSRVKAMQALFQIDVGHISPEKALCYTFDTERATDLANEFGPSLVLGVLENQDAIDELIARKSPEWDLKRMASVERSVLRLAVYELLFTKDTPYKVIINEAIELAKSYSDHESGAFVNGVLDEIWRTCKREASS